MANEVGEELKDEVNGKVINWNEKKQANQYFLQVIEPIIKQTYDEEHYKTVLSRIDNCAEILKHYRDTDGNMRLYQAWFCKNRYCPMCAWRKSLKDGFILSQVLGEFKQKYPKARLLFLTLTLNDTGVYDSASIRERVAELKKSASKMFRNKRIKDYILGLVKSLEVTVKPDKHSDTGLRFHVHLHLMIGVKASYFMGQNYLSKMEWG